MKWSAVGGGACRAAAACARGPDEDCARPLHSSDRRGPGGQVPVTEAAGGDAAKAGGAGAPAAAKAKDAAGATDARAAPADAKAAGGAGGNDTAAAPKTQTVTRTRPRTVRVPLAVGGPGLRMPGLTPAQLAAARGRLQALEARDADKRAAAAAKNGLEAYIIATRGAVEADDVLAKAREP